MKLTRNIGLIHALFRITIGLFLLGWSTARLAKYPRKTFYLFFTFMGAMKTGEGLLHYSLMKDLAQSFASEEDKPQLKKIIDIMVPEEEETAEDPAESPKTDI